MGTCSSYPRAEGTWLTLTLPVGEIASALRGEMARLLRTFAGTEATPVQARLFQVADAFEKGES